MQRKFESKTRGQLFVEQVVWNAAAGASLAVMVLLLLFSLQWLDHVSPSPNSDPRVGGAPAAAARPAVASDRNTIDAIDAIDAIGIRATDSMGQATEVAGGIGPSG